jgi:hypothetical protein
MNTSHSTTHKHTPFFLNFGREMITPRLSEMGITDPRVTLSDWKYEQLRNLHIGADLARRYTELSQEKMKAQSSEDTQYNVGEFVKVRKHEVKNKFESPYCGPYKVIERIGKNNYKLDLGVFYHAEYHSDFSQCGIGGMERKSTASDDESPGSD